MKRITIGKIMNHLSVIIFVGIGIAITAIGINFYLWDDEAKVTAPAIEDTKSRPHSTSPNGKQIPSKKTQSPPSSANTHRTQKDLDAPKQQLIKPTFDVVRITPEGYAVLAGRAKPNTLILILDDKNILGQVDVDGNGEWVFVPEKPFPPGNRQLSLKQQTKDGIETIVSNKVVVIVVPKTNQKKTNGKTTLPKQALALKFPRTMDGPSTVLQKPTPTSANLRLSLDTVDYDEQGRLHISGRGNPKTTVQIYLNELLIGRSVVDKNGNWRHKPNELVKPGTYTLRIDEVNTAGKVLARIELPFVRSKPSVSEVSKPSIIVQPGNSLWRIARRVYGVGFRFTTIYAANKNQIKDPDLIYPGQVFTVPEPGTN